MKKLITVVYSATVAIDVPEGISDEQIFAADQKRVCLTGDEEKLITKILQEASAQIGWRDGEITDIQEEMPDAPPYPFDGNLPHLTK